MRATSYPETFEGTQALKKHILSMCPKDIKIIHFTVQKLPSYDDRKLKVDLFIQLMGSEGPTNLVTIKLNNLKYLTRGVFIRKMAKASRRLKNPKLPYNVTTETL